MKAALRSLPFLAAVLTLGAHAAILGVHEMPGSFRKYTLAAEQQLSGKLPPERPMDLSPLYFEAALAATRLVELSVPLSPEGARRRADPVLVALQLLLTAASAGLLARLLERRFGRALAGVGVLVFLLDRHVLVYERILEPEVCLLFFILGWFFFLEERTLGAAASWLGPAAAGILAGASLLTRPTFLPLALTVPVCFRLREKDRWIRKSLVFAAPVAAAAVLLLVRAAAVTGDPRTPMMNPGTVFYEGNQPLSHGTSAVYPPAVLGLLRIDEDRPDAPHEYYRAVARAAVGENLSISEVNAFWSGLALGYIRAEPRRFLALLRDKLRYAFHSYRWHDVGTAWRYDQGLRLPFVPFAWLSAVGLAGMVFEARRGSRAFLFFGLAGMQIAVMVVFYVSARQRMVLLPAMIYFALAGLEKLVQERRRLRRSLPLAAFVVLLAVSFSFSDDWIRDDHYLRQERPIAQQRFDELRERAKEQPMAALVDLALDGYRHSPAATWVPAYFPQERRTFDEDLADLLARESRPGVPAAFDRAGVFLRAGRLDEAETIFSTLALAGRRVYRKGSEPSLPRFHLARIAALRADLEGAVRLLEEELGRSPGDPFVLAELVVLTGDRRYREALSTGVSEIDAQYLLGQAYAHHGRAREAAAALGFVVERLPELRGARILLAAALGEVGRVDDGAALYLETVRRDPDPLILSAQIRELFRRWAALHPDDPWTQLVSGHVLHEHGYFTEAMEILETIGTPPPALAARVEEEKRRIREALALLPAI